jgi:Mce-associated membrane protein
MATSPTWYDLLGVERGASPDEIRTAWRAATDRAEPGTRQFKSYNQAAEVLLDPRARAAYDAELGPDVAQGVTLDKDPEQPRDESAGAPGVAAPAEDLEPERPATSSTEVPTTAPVTVGEPGTTPALVAFLASTLVTVVVSVLTVLVIAVGAWFWFQNHQHAQQDDAGQEASAAAERALPVVLSYDYRQLTADRDRAVRFLSPSYKKEYTATFDKLIASQGGKPGAAQQTSAVVKATVRSVGVVDAETDVAKVIVFVDQATTKSGGAPKYSLNRLTVSLVKSGNSWLVDNINSY